MASPFSKESFRHEPGESSPTQVVATPAPGLTRNMENPMSQAENVPTTTRRSFVRSAAVASVTLPAAIANTGPADASERELLALESEMSHVWEHLGAALDLYDVAETRVAAWTKANPKPTLREPTKAETKHFRQHIGRQLADGEPLRANYGGEYEKAEAAHKRAIEGWEAAHEKAEEELGYNRADQLVRLAWARIDALREAMTAIRATTLEGIRCKARVSVKIDESASTEPALALSVVEDLAGPTSEQQS
jgi:hypothetical protein